ncbi:peptidylprolyl isomerase domain and WD repeat-containing protein 1-like [Ptychodera flava]|uniref:peptidylprolyl isomerase domain and WD repeat-containing protein 1-like n=1 Tax=Ptychodera flava TaxID=63121 RepID=UPI00396A9402
MAASMAGVKRSVDDKDDGTGQESSEDEMIGPMPTLAAKPKKRKVLEYEHVYLNNLPSAETYERSYMHRDVITHVAVTKTQFVITASVDGFVKFWKKQDHGIEFVKLFRAHLGTIRCIAVSSDGLFLCTIAEDKALKVFDIVSFDMINMMKLPYVPQCCEWIYSPGDPLFAVACSNEKGEVFIYDGNGDNTPLHTLDKIHSKPLTFMKYNPLFDVMLSADTSGMLEYWTGPKYNYAFPKNVNFKFKTDTDLYEFAKSKTVPTTLSFSPDGKTFATMAMDRKVRVFRFLTGKLTKVLDESLQRFTELQQMKQQLPDMEFGRRMAQERDLEKSGSLKWANVVFDQSGHFIMYATMLGIKVINLHTNRCTLNLGKPENNRFLHLSLFQGRITKNKAAETLEMKASENPLLQNVSDDPTLFCTAFKKNRFFMFTKRLPEDTKSADSERDVFNEKPSKEEVMAATQNPISQRISENAIIHTSMGDMHIKLFPVECPKTVENFCVHSKSGYYNGHIFHRVIKQFMIQTGDPLGTGTGGESIWGGEFEDEFRPNLRHDRPYTVSMANAGPDSNGSQFFITVVPSSWLDNKHTVFGRVVKGMEVAQKISEVKTNPKTDKPYDDIRIISISIK